MKKQKIVVSLSGGATSGNMAREMQLDMNLKPVHVYRNSGKPYYTKHVNDSVELINVFANTTREDKRTLVFVNNMDVNFGFYTVWLESQVYHNKRKSSGFKITDFNHAKSDGSVFEQVIIKYGIPNTKFLHCTRETKERPIDAFRKDIGFYEDTLLAIGFRYDEPKRVNLLKAKQKGHIYPLWEKKRTKDDVRKFWEKQSFQLGIEEFEGNCRLCYKKSKRKLLSQIIKDPTSVNWILEMELNYAGNDGHTFFRGNESIIDLIEESTRPFEFWKPKEKKQIEFDFDLDEQDSCAESCEPFQN